MPGRIAFGVIGLLLTPLLLPGRESGVSGRYNDGVEGLDELIARAASWVMVPLRSLSVSCWSWMSLMLSSVFKFGSAVTSSSR